MSGYRVYQGLKALELFEFYRPGLVIGEVRCGFAGKGVGEVICGRPTRSADQRAEKFTFENFLACCFFSWLNIPVGQIRALLAKLIDRSTRPVTLRTDSRDLSLAQLNHRLMLRLTLVPLPTTR